MKKVKHILSSVCEKISVNKCTALVSVAAVAVSSVACAVYFTTDTNITAKAGNAENSQKMILELSESFLSPNLNTNISVLEIPADRNSENTSDALDLIEELSTGSESKNNEEAETITQAPETTEAPETTQAPAVEPTEAQTEEITSAEITTSDSITGGQPGYSFSELGLTQMSDIPVPDSIRFDENGIPLSYRYVISGKTTTYTMGTMTATGTPVHPGVVAVNPRIIPYGTKMYIIANDGSGHIYGYSSAEDTGGFIYMSNGPLVDMYVNCWDDSVAWANKPVDIYIF